MYYSSFCLLSIKPFALFLSFLSPLSPSRLGPATPTFSLCWIQRKIVRIISLQAPHIISFVPNVRGVPGPLFLSDIWEILLLLLFFFVQKIWWLPFYPVLAVAPSVRSRTAQSFPCPRPSALSWSEGPDDARTSSVPCGKNIVGGNFAPNCTKSI